MFELSPATLIMVIAVSLFTAVAAFCDLRTRRIPNKLTIPMFFGGWIYQIAMSFMDGWHHLGSAALGFLVGFGLLFVLWFIGGGGGGDVKLIGALSVWLGFKLTLTVLFVSTLLVLIATVVIVVWNILSKGMRQTQKKYVGTNRTAKERNAGPETREQKVGRRVMAFAGPVAVATWGVMIWYGPQLDQILGSAPPEAPSTAQQTEGN